MKSSLFNHYIIGLLLVLLTACDREVPNVQLKNIRSKLVVTSFISPQNQNIDVRVTESTPINTKETQGVLKATVLLSDGSRQVEIPYSSSSSMYTHTLDAKLFPIEAGKTYSIRVSVPDGRTVTASCTVPFPNKTLSVELKDPAFKETSHRFKYNWQDTPGQRDYYRVTGSFSQSTDYFSVYWDKNPSLKTDVRFDGTLFSSLSQGSYTLGTKQTLYASLWTVDENYYQYHDTFIRYEETNGNPFAEPVLLYTNIKDGLGVFAAYNQFTITQQLP